MRASAAGCLGIVLGIVVVLLAGCQDDAPPEPAPRVWVEGELPVPDGPDGRVAVRSAIRCADSWLAVGGVYLSSPTETRDSRPAAWRSTDGVTWTALDIETRTYWGRRAILTTVACSRGRAVAVGARAGGAHAYPRVTSFHEDGSGLVDQPAVFTLYGGATATNVGPLAGADPGWLIAGNRLSGPAAWHSADGREFTLEEGVAELSDDAGGSSLAQAATWDGSQWVMVGGGTSQGSSDREPLAWESPDGSTWERVEVPGSDGYDDLERVVPVGDDLVALGLRGTGFGVWRREDDAWLAGASFGERPEDAGASPFVSSLVSAASGVWSTISDGAAYSLWHSEDGADWSTVALPVRAPETAGDRVLTVAAAGEDVLLLVDDGSAGRVWSAAE